jgi:hypothetical protein
MGRNNDAKIERIEQQRASRYDEVHDEQNP